jgi:hypothetical protein
MSRNPADIGLTVRKIVNEDERLNAISAAKEDNHNLLFPSHLLRKNGDIVGAWSLAAIPLCLVWSHSKRISARDSFTFSGVMDTLMLERNFNFYLMACDSDSNYYPHMEQLGYKFVWPTNIFYKQL